MLQNYTIKLVLMFPVVSLLQSQQINNISVPDINKLLKHLFFGCIFILDNLLIYKMYKLNLIDAYNGKMNENESNFQHPVKLYSVYGSQYSVWCREAGNEYRVSG